MRPDSATFPSDFDAGVRRLPPPPADARTWAQQVRVRQWSKNLLVFAVPAAADGLGRSFVLGRTAVTFLVFCLLSSAVYLVNDLFDAEEDRGHPRKRHRPIAAGMIGTQEALIAAGGCLFLALISSAMVDSRLLMIAVAYAGLNLAYTGWGRRIAFLDIVAVAGCFVLRAMAGGAATGTRISTWFILVVSLAAILVAAGKRYADLLDPSAHRSRAVLERYELGHLRLIGIIACAGALCAYAIWAFAGGHTDSPLARELTLVPFSLSMLRYAWLVKEGQGGAPEVVILRDRFMQVACGVWLMLFLAGA